MDDISRVAQQKDKKKGGKQQWGPVLPIKRSTKNLDNNKPMMEKAIEVKRKWNLEDRAGTNKNPKPSKTHLLSIAKDIGLDVLDGNPSVVDKMIELDCSRTPASKKVCSHDKCDIASSSNSSIINISVDGESLARAETSRQAKDGDPNAQMSDQEDGWSKVGPRKKNRRNKK